MNREEAFELELAEWLEDGPFTAPDHIVTAAIQHARTHPRRTALRLAFWRRTMSEIHTAPLTERRRLHMGRGLTVGLTGLAIVLIVAIASAALVIPRVLTVATTPPPSAAVTGTITIGSLLDKGTTTGVGEDIDQVHGKKFDADWTGNDPRIVGASAFVENTETFLSYGFASNDKFGGAPTKTWGTITLTGPQGTWTGSFAGLIEKYGNQRLAAVLLGSGAYQGLEYRFTAMSSTGARFDTAGAIEPVPSQPLNSSANTQVMGTDTCGAMNPLPSPAQPGGAVSAVRNVSQTCTVKTNDPRVNGTAARHVGEYWNMSGDITSWGTSQIVNDGGGWTGVYEIAMLGDIEQTSFAYVGSGGYAGLRFSGGGTYSTPDSFVVSASIEPIA